MLQQWSEMVAGNRAAGSLFAEQNPPMSAAFKGLNGAQTGNGALDAKTRELIAMAVAVTTRCDGCIGAHAAAARSHGATEEEMSDALGVAIALNAGAAYIYSLRAMDAFTAAGE